jgi:hypothetical protein
MASHKQECCLKQQQQQQARTRRSRNIVEVSNNTNPRVLYVTS